MLGNHRKKTHNSNKLYKIWKGAKYIFLIEWKNCKWEIQKEKRKFINGILEEAEKDRLQVLKYFNYWYKYIYFLCMWRLTLQSSRQNASGYMGSSRSEAVRSDELLAYRENVCGGFTWLINLWSVNFFFVDAHNKGKLRKRVFSFLKVRS